MEKTICELFAGVGGFRLGFERASRQWKTVWFSQWEPGKTKQYAHDCYVAHFGTSLDLMGQDTTGTDIAVVDKRLIPDHNLLVGGFPCQDYSVARPLPGSKGINGKKGVLWWQIRNILEEKNAPFGLFENVDRLLKSPANQRGRDFGVILACLASLGYSAEWRVVNAAEYGGVQRRRRTFIFAYKNNTRYAQGFVGSEDYGRILCKSGFFAKAFPVQGCDISSWNNTTLDYIDIPSVSENFKFEFQNAGYMHDGHVVTAKVAPLQDVKLSAIPLKQILERNVDEKYYLGDNTSKWEYLKGAKKITRTSKTGHTYEFTEGAIAFPDPIDKPARTMLTSESSLNRSTHVIRDPQTGRLRLLTPNEADRIQGFVLPDKIRDKAGNELGWTSLGGMPEKFRYFCMGNALVVPMITRMAKILGKIIDTE